MSETVTVNRELGIIEIRQLGTVTAEDVRTSIKEVQRLRDLHGIAEVLVDAAEVTEALATFPAFEIAPTLPAEVRIALVVSEQAETASNYRFMETAARNRGAQIRRFESREEAVGWLKQS